mmetsp:Transcript_23338/g.59729  ORF Transcript_23338/g.59729 Transcript_23338/m.59729 type:complete len:270 (-) Transcript_23338:713-1522(-)
MASSAKVVPTAVKKTKTIKQQNYEEFNERREKDGWGDDLEVITWITEKVEWVLDQCQELTEEERELLVSSTLILDHKLEVDGNGDVRALAATARIYSIDGEGCVDVDHDYFHRERLYGDVEHCQAIKFAIRDPPKSTQPHAEKGWSRVNTSYTATQSIREVLFTGSEVGDAISAKLSDHHLLSWVLAAAAVPAKPDTCPFLGGSHQVSAFSLRGVSTETTWEGDSWGCGGEEEEEECEVVAPARKKARSVSGAAAHLRSAVVAAVPSRG